MRAIIRPVLVFGIPLGAHGFVEITGNPEVNSGRRTTLGGYSTTPLAGNLIKGENYYADYDLSEVQYLKVTDIKADNEQGQIQMELNAYNAFKNLDNELGAYSLFGGITNHNQGNSGNVYTETLLSAGLSFEEILDTRAESYSIFLGPDVYNAGIGNRLPQNPSVSAVNLSSSVIKSLESLAKRIREVTPLNE